MCWDLGEVALKMFQRPFWHLIKQEACNFIVMQNLKELQHRKPNKKHDSRDLTGGFQKSSLIQLQNL